MFFLRILRLHHMQKRRYLANSVQKIIKKILEKDLSILISKKILKSPFHTGRHYRFPQYPNGLVIIFIRT